MTTAITRARPEDVLRAAALLGATADKLGTAVAACRRSAAVRWVGRAQEAYQARLGRFATDLIVVRTAFDTACDALLDYARSLGAAQQTAAEADRLTALADEALLDRVADLRWAAAQQEAAAAARLVVALDELTARAPRHSTWVAVQHDAASVAAGMHDWFSGWGQLAAAAFGALPGVGSAGDRSRARDELASQAADAVQPWKQVEALVRALRDGQGFRVGGSLAMAAVFRVPGKEPSWEVELFGTQDALSLALLSVMRRGLTGTPLELWAAERLQARLVADLRRLQRVRLPSLDALLADGVDLTLHEAHAGHTMWKHIGRDVDFLRLRQDVERPFRTGDVSSFDHLDQAEAVVDDVLRANAAEVRAFLRRAPGAKRSFDASLAEPVGTLLAADGIRVPATGARVVLQRGPGRSVNVITAYLL